MSPTFPISPVSAPRTPTAFRREVRNLISSYHDVDLDVVAELLQNSIDAIEDLYSGSRPAQETPRIEIQIDTRRGVFRIADNGPGLTDSVVESLAVPELCTTKEGGRKRGHKGVGLSFAIWSSVKFRFATKTGGRPEITAGYLEGGFDWVEGHSETAPTIELDEHFRPGFLSDQDSGTVIELTFGSDSPLIKILERLNTQGIRTFLRTCTAAGYINLRSEDPRRYPRWVSTTDLSVRVNSSPPVQVPLGFYFLHEAFRGDAMAIDALRQLSPNRIRRLFGRKRCLFATLSNPQIRNLFTAEEDSELLRLVREQNCVAYGAFTDQAAAFKELNDSLYREGVGRGPRRKIVEPGIHICSATMPVGEMVEADLPFGAGNKDRLYVVLQFDNISPDVGRKTFAKPVTIIGQRVAQNLTKLFVDNRAVLIPHGRAHGVTEGEQRMAIQALIDAAASRRSLEITNLGIVKEPGTEQDVVALFHALLGATALHGYRVQSVFGSTAKYDGVFTYWLENSEENRAPRNPLGLPRPSFPENGGPLEFPPSILEFKQQVSDLILDFETGMKNFEDIDLLVAWDTGDQGAFGPTSNYELEAVDHRRRDKQFYAETHLLREKGGSGEPIHVILLREVIVTLAQQLAGESPRADELQPEGSSDIRAEG